MKDFTSVRLGVAIVILALCGSVLQSSAAPAQGTAALQRNVIVILRDQMPNMPAVRGARAARAAALAAAQGPIVSHLQASGASRIRGFALINAVTATVSPAEEQQLAAHPLVAAVVPEIVIKLPRPANPKSPRSNWGGGGGGGGGAGAPLCNTLEPEALQLTHSAYIDPDTPQAQRVKDGHGQFVTGKGVKVAWIADGLDPTVQGFVRPDGTSVFIDYQDFSGDPAGTPTGGGEAFGDASSIAAQDNPNGKPLTFDISQYLDTALGTLPSSPCNIRIRGMAPGASLVGLKVFSSIGSTTNTAHRSGDRLRRQPRRRGCHQRVLRQQSVPRQRQRSDHARGRGGSGGRRNGCVQHRGCRHQRHHGRTVDRFARDFRRRNHATAPVCAGRLRCLVLCNRRLAQQQHLGIQFRRLQHEWAAHT